MVLSASYDTSVRCWDCRSRNHLPVQTMREASDSVSHVAVASHEISTSSIDGRVRRYDLRAGSLAVGAPPRLEPKL